MGRHRSSQAPPTPLVGWGLFATALTCVLLLWRGRDWQVVAALGALGLVATLVLWVVDRRARGQAAQPDPDAAGPRLHDRPPSGLPGGADHG
ncbi:MAG: hypothetical protein U0Q15_19845 [Kineosporiaceae bacterium]